ncbi:Golgi apparatus membrane protein TVP38 [Termitomyces sp. T112]|nr:Golgi apparatus membrane protein TVP38 [Termitomyces sp. T112]
MPTEFPSPISILKEYVSIVYRKYRSLHILGKTFIWLIVLFYICFGTFIIVVTPARIAQYLYDQAQLLAETHFGWLVLASLLVVVSFPPLLGHTTIVTLCGFAYGMQGFIITAFATLVGASSVFVVLRFLFNQHLRRWSERSQKWQALESLVRTKGLPLIILIRISPFPPWVYSNSLFASIEAVSFWQYVTATIFVFPRLLLHVFIGSRIAALSDGNQRGHMDKQTKIINGLLIIGGFILAVCTSWLVYSMVQKHAQHLQESFHELAADTTADSSEDDPLLRPSSPIVDDCA